MTERKPSSVSTSNRYCAIAFTNGEQLVHYSHADQVVIYRSALAVTVTRFHQALRPRAKALCWTLVYHLDFLMTSGISIIDGSIQASFHGRNGTILSTWFFCKASALALADVAAALAVLFVPLGSRLLAAVVFRLLGLSALLLVALGNTPGAKSSK